MNRIRILQIAFVAVALLFIARLFILQVIDHRLYAALAEGQHDLYKNLFPERGDIVITDRSGKIFPLATNQDLYLLYAEPNKIKDAAAAAKSLGEILNIEPEILLARLDRPEDPYEPLQHGLTQETADHIKTLNLAGIGIRTERARLYPEPGLGGHAVGFVGSDESGNLAGRYGVESFYERELAGEAGYVAGGRDVRGGFVPVGDATVKPAQNGVTLTLTIDRSIQFVACDRLRKAVARHSARGGVIIIMDPKNGAILALCGAPDYDPNNFRSVKSPRVFLNPAVNAQYEPGSIMKPITMAAALESGAVTPFTTYEDTGSVRFGAHAIKNSDEKSYGTQTMTEVLTKSLNTGAIFAMRAAGAEKFRSMINALGFGQPTGIDLPAEVSGDLRALEERGEIYRATASFGQGIAVTPLQMVRAFAAIANGGLLPHPHILKDARLPPPTRAMSEKTSTVLGGMLASVVEKGHGKRAKVPGYFIAGKTGTAQLPKPGGGYFEKETIGSFIGFAPLDNPRFVMLARIDVPQDVKFAESSAAPLFGEIASFLLHYLEVAPQEPS